MSCPTYLVGFFSPSVRMSGWLGHPRYRPLPSAVQSGTSHRSCQLPISALKRRNADQDLVTFCWTVRPIRPLRGAETSGSNTQCRHAPEEWIAPCNGWVDAHFKFRRLCVCSSSVNSLNAELTLILLTWRIWWANNASKWQMGFSSAFKRLNSICWHY